MASVERRVGPAVGTGSAVTIYTAPSGTALGSLRGARLLWTHHCNTAGTPGTAGLSVGAMAAGTQIITPSLQLLAVEHKSEYWDIPLEPGDIIQASHGTAVTLALTVEEFIVGT